MRKLSPAVVLTLVFLVSFLLHFRIFSTDIVGPHAWRQTVTQSNIDCFYEEDNSIFHPRQLARGNGDGIKQAEFPVMQWIIAQSYSVFGQSITVTRIFCFLFGLLSIAGFYFLLRESVAQQNVVYAGTIMFSFSPLFFYYMINPLPDLFALTTAIWAAFFYLKSDKNESAVGFAIASLFLTLAVLAKLPYILFAGIPLGILINRVREKKPRTGTVSLLLSAALITPAVMWYAHVLPGMQWNAALGGVFSDTKEGSPVVEALMGNLVSSLPELYLNYLSVPLFLVGLYVLIQKRKKLFREYLPFTLTGILALCYFFYEINLISTVHDYYMLPFIPLLFIVATAGWKHVSENGGRFLRIIATILVLLTPLTAFLRINSRWNVHDPGFPADWHAHRDELRVAVPDDALVIMGSDMTQAIMPYYVHKRGWTYFDYELTRVHLEELIGKGAKYLYTDCPATLRDTSLQIHFKRKIGKYGSVRVFELQ